MDYFSPLIGSVVVEWTLGPVKKIQDYVPKSEVGKDDASIDQQAVSDPRNRFKALCCLKIIRE